MKPGFRAFDKQLHLQRLGKARTEAAKLPSVKPTAEEQKAVSVAVNRLRRDIRRPKRYEE
jgi:hypothetical protein